MADFYPDDMEEQAPSGTDTPTEKKDAYEGETALLPKSLIAGKDLQPGDEIVLKVVHLYDDEVEVACAPDNEEEGESTEKMEDSEPMQEAMGKLSAMAG